MSQHDLWKYCTGDQCRELLLSFRLLGENGWPDEKVTACLYALSNHAERHYAQVRIPKRGGGTRALWVPDPLLKNVQKHILHHILDGRHISAGAFAYRRGISALQGASLHVGKKTLLKLDIENFFGTITFPMVLRTAFSAQYFPPSVGTLLTSLCCCRDCLPQGAPTSPAISNLVLRPFDEHMAQWCGERGITYSRYCDDMTFSGEFDAAEVRRKGYGYLRAMGFEPNRKKTKILSRGNRQTVTGIVVNEKPQLPREYRRNLRQSLYYCGKYGVEEHLKQIGDREYLPEGRAGILRYLKSVLGKIDYVLTVNPDDAWFQKAGEAVRAAIRELTEQEATVIRAAYEEPETIRRLFGEYTASLGIDLAFQHYEEEISRLPGKYGPPDGRLYLICYEGKPAGCGALRRFDEKRCEFKRVYIRPEFRGKHLGKKMMEHLIRAAREAGYESGLLDTLSTMERAVAMYRGLGFRPISPYYDNPLKDAVLFEIEL